MALAQAGTNLKGHKVVSEQEWNAARAQLLEKEKEWTRQKDVLSRMRRDLPWLRVEKTYTFQGPNGPKTLADLFEGRSQLVLYHFMFAPDWSEGCSGCSFIADHVDAARQHFEHLDISFAAVSLAPVSKVVAFKKRMGWKFNWVSSEGTDFNYDFNVSYRQSDLDAGPVFHNFTLQKLSGEEQHGTSVLYKGENGNIYRTYQSFERGDEAMIGAYSFIDLTPKGRQESSPMDWIRLHDEY